MISSTLVAIVKKGEASKLMSAARAKGAPGGSVISARGTATNSILAALGLGDTSREVLLSVVERETRQGQRDRTRDRCLQRC